MNNFYDAVYRLVRDIPRGRVMTYGQVATILGSPRAARAVGYALLMCGKKDRVPWQRVINARGGISVGGDPDRPRLQRALLEKERVKFNEEDCCDLRKYRWEPAKPDDYYIEGMDNTDLPFR